MNPPTHSKIAHCLRAFLFFPYAVLQSIKMWGRQLSTPKATASPSGRPDHYFSSTSNQWIPEPDQWPSAEPDFRDITRRRKEGHSALHSSLARSARDRKRSLAQHHQPHRHNDHPPMTRRTGISRTPILFAMGLRSSLWTTGNK
jgi:hypothetical protein